MWQNILFILVPLVVLIPVLIYVSGKYGASRQESKQNKKALDNVVEVNAARDELRRDSAKRRRLRDKYNN